jgi:hypothetical protein
VTAERSRKVWGKNGVTETLTVKSDAASEDSPFDQPEIMDGYPLEKSEQDAIDKSLRNYQQAVEAT